MPRVAFCIFRYRNSSDALMELVEAEATRSGCLHVGVQESFFTFAKLLNIHGERSRD